MAQNQQSKSNAKATGAAPAVHALVLSFRGRDVVQECLDTLLASSYPNLTVVLLDNGCTDGTPEFVAAQYGDRVEIMPQGGNLGFATANNNGIKAALGRGAEYVLLLNDDIVVDPEMVSELVEVAESDPSIGMTGPKIYYWKPSDQIWFAGGEVSLAKGTTRHIGIRERDNGQYDRQVDVDYLTGCALLVKRELIEHVGVLDPGYRMYFEDTDWSMRAAETGWRRVYVPTAKLWHKISVSSGGQLSPLKLRRKLASSWRFFTRYARWYHFLSIPIFQVLDAFRILALLAGGRLQNTWDDA